jgi:hypothetical protein
MTQTINQTEQVQKYAEQLCETLTDARADYMKRLRQNKDGGFDPWNLDEDGNYKPEDHPDYFTFIIGKRYLKVVVMEWKDDAQYGRINAAPAGYVAASVHAFIDKKTGDVFKAAAWSAPAKGVRYNILTQTETLLKRAGNDGGFGGYLYY